MRTKSDDPANRNLIGRKLGRYEVLIKIASGGMAAVYVARAQGIAGFERLVAIKVLHANLAHEEEFITMFLDEARLAARIRHPNVVPTIDIAGSVDSGYFIVMDYIEGEHLGRLISTANKMNERLPPRVVLRIIADALLGLGAAHSLTDETGKSLNLVHRDVSPHNIMVGVDGISRLTDFGIAKAEDRLTHTREGQIKGKLAYMAPEQASMGRTDSRSDLFSMGIILWEALTGQRLFRAGSTAGTLNRLISEPIPSPSSVNDELKPYDALLNKALTRDPDERFQNANDFIDMIEETAGQVGGMGSLRRVGQTAKAIAGEKIELEKSRIKQASQSLGYADITSGVHLSVREEGSMELHSQPGGSGTGSSSSSSSEAQRSSLEASPTEMSGVHIHATVPDLNQEEIQISLPPGVKASDSIPPKAPVAKEKESADTQSMISVLDRYQREVSFRRRIFVLIFAVCVVLLSAGIWFAYRNDYEKIRVTEMPQDRSRPPDKEAAKTDGREMPSVREPKTEKTETPTPIQDAPSVAKQHEKTSEEETEANETQSLRKGVKSYKKRGSSQKDRRKPGEPKINEFIPNPYHN